MDFRLNDEQLALQQAVREFCTKEITSEVVRAAADGTDGDAPELWKKMAELGWLGLTVPEARGGLGMSLVEQAVVAEQLGYRNAPGAWFSSAALAIPAVLTFGADDLVELLVSGAMKATVALETDLVLDAAIVDAVIADADGTARWFTRDELEVTPDESLDATRRLGAMTTTGEGRELGPTERLAPVLDGATALLCAEMVGGMQWALDETVAYVKEREQFGRPVGSFQAVQHRCADMLLRTESARSAAYYAAYACANEQDDASFAVSVAKAYCSDAAQWVTGQGIQLHGGIGYTWEHDMHLYFKRATMNQVLLGDAAHHRERAMQLDPVLDQTEV